MLICSQGLGTGPGTQEVLEGCHVALFLCVNKKYSRKVLSLELLLNLGPPQQPHCFRRDWQGAVTSDWLEIAEFQTFILFISYNYWDLERGHPKRKQGNGQMDPSKVPPSSEKYMILRPPVTEVEAASEENLQLHSKWSFYLVATIIGQAIRIQVSRIFSYISKKINHPQEQNLHIVINW